jgi:hypothetical protein
MEVTMRRPLIRQHWLNTVSEWKKSALSQKDWCLAFDLNTNTFNWWKQKLYPRKSIKENVLNAFPHATQIFLYDDLINIAWSFDRLSEMVYEFIPCHLIASSYFVFLSKHRTYLKIFYFDEDGPNILFKRLERGAYVLSKEVSPKTKKFSVL